MEMIRLTEEEKQALRGIKDGTSQDETLMVWADVVASLQDKRIMEACFEGQELRRGRLSLLYPLCGGEVFVPILMHLLSIILYFVPQEVL